MKKNILFITLLALIAFGQTAWAQSSVHVQSESDLRSKLVDTQYDNYTIVLDADITISSNGGGELSVHSHKTIDLNGHNIRAEYNASFRLFHIASDGHLTLMNDNNREGELCDGKITSSEDGGGAIRNEGTVIIEEKVRIKSCTASDYGGAIYNNGTLYINDGTITNNSARHGGAIYNNGTLYINGGDISHNTSSEDGGAIYSTFGHSITMTDGTISNNSTSLHGGGGINLFGTMTMSGGHIMFNTCVGTGGGIWVGDDAVLTMTGGTITDNTANNGDSDGIMVRGTINMSGEPCVSNNEVGNVYLANSNTITVNGAFNIPRANIWVTREVATGTFTNGYAANNPQTNPTSFFYSDNSNYSITLYNQEAILFQNQWTSGNTTCILASNGTFTVSAIANTNGAMADYTSPPGWYDWRDLITTVVIGEGVTKIGDHAFDGCTNTNDVYLHESLTAANLTWNNASSSFKPNKATNCHVHPLQLSAFQSKFPNVNVTFVSLIVNLTLYADQDNTAVLTAWNGVTANVTLQGTTFYRDGRWNVFTLPFTQSGADGIFSSASDIKCVDPSSSYNNGDLTVSLSSESIFTAGTPYLVRWNSGNNIVNPTFERVTISASAATTVNNNANDVHFHGNFAPVNLTVGSTRNLYVGTDSKLHYPVDGNATVNAFTGYFTVDGDVSTYTFGDKTGNFYVFETAGYWNDGSNWFTGSVPPAGSDVTINASVTIPFGYTANAGVIDIQEGNTLTIADGAQLFQSNTNLIAKVEKRIYPYSSDQDGWNFIASPVATALTTANITGLIPTDATIYDLYYLDEKETYWRNYKQHVGNVDPGFDIVPKKGYLYANQTGTTIQFEGVLQPYVEQGVSVPLNKEGNGWNLVGNPFTFNAVVNKPYYTLGVNGTAIPNIKTLAIIPPCTGIIVKADSLNESVTFMKPEAVGASDNRGHLDIVVTQTNTRNNAVQDKAIVSFFEGSVLPKFRFGNHAEVYIPQGTEDYAIAFAEKRGEVPVNFKATETGSYTLTVNPESVEMAYLHLIDNLTNTDVDLLVEPSYTFTGDADDVTSRFRLVFVANDADLSAEGNEDFAFISNGQIILTGVESNSVLQIIDITGRIIVSRRDAMHCVSTSGMTPGVYVLRLINGEDVRTQKILVK